MPLTVALLLLNSSFIVLRQYFIILGQLISQRSPRFIKLLSLLRTIGHGASNNFLREKKNNTKVKANYNGSSIKYRVLSVLKVWRTRTKSSNFLRLLSLLWTTGHGASNNFLKEKKTNTKFKANYNGSSIKYRVLSILKVWRTEHMGIVQWMMWT